jgi:hypothetical protein
MDDVEEEVGEHEQDGEEKSCKGGGQGTLVDKIVTDSSWKLSSEALNVRSYLFYIFVYLITHRN